MRTTATIATSLTRTGKLDLTNRKPYRTASQKQQARDNAHKVNGTYVSNATVSFSKQKRGER